MRYDELTSGTIFRFENEATTEVYEKVSSTHYRRGMYKIGNICQPITNRPLGTAEPVTTNITIYPARRYLGGSLYAEMEGDKLKLTDSESGTTQTIVLEEHQVNKLCRYWDDVVKASNPPDVW
jgi:hypothetical protein